MLLSLDGGAADDFERLRAAGAFSGGFARLLAAGESARYALPVSPTATSVNHASIASGFPPARTGIVSNAFHVAGLPLGERTAGLATPSETESLWTAARRQGKRVGIVAYPGVEADGPRGDWGIDWIRPLTRSRMVLLGAAEWRPLTGPERLADRRRSYSPPLAARIGPGAAGAEACEAIAVDRTDDGRVDYDELLLPCGDPSGRTQPAVRPGQWIPLRFELAAPGGESGAGGEGEPPVPALAWCKLLALDPATAEATLYLGAAASTGGYPAAFAASLRQNGLRWPGGPDDRLTAARWKGEPGIDLETWFGQSQRLTRFLVDTLLLGDRRRDTDLVMGYLPALDQAGHLLLLEDPRQPYYSEARRVELRQMRDRVWRMMDQELGRLLDGIDLRTTTVLVVSDHGMQPVHTAIDVNAVLERAGLLAFSAPDRIDPNRTRVWAVGYGGVVHVYLNLLDREPAGIVTAAEAPDLVERVRALLAGLAAEPGGERPVAAVYTRAEAGPIGLDHPHSGDLVAFARAGYVFRHDWHAGAPVAGTPTSYGDHAYANTLDSMRALFLAAGRGVPQQKTGPRSLLDVAPRVARWLGIEPPRATSTAGGR